jgi:hypothetical protein
VVVPKFFALNATNGPIGQLFVGRSITNNMERKLALQVPQNAKFLNCLASGPQLDLLEAIPRQMRSVYSNGMFQEAHAAVPRCSIVARVYQTCFKKIPIWKSPFQISNATRSRMSCGVQSLSNRDKSPSTKTV